MGVRAALACSLAAFALSALSSCREPTSLTVEVWSDVDCASRPQVVVIGGPALTELANRAPSTSSTSCATDGRVGRVVVLPSDGDSVAFAVATRQGGAPPEECFATPPAKGCIVARRQLRFVENTALEMRLDLRGSCTDVVCPAEETCVVGLCVPAQVPDCAKGCAEAALLPTGALPGGLPGWQPVASMPTARDYSAVALGGDGRIYVAGGRIASGRTAVNEAYDAVTGAWSTATPLPTALESMAAAAGRDGRVYVFGGGGGTRSALVYDPAASTWTALPAMPTGRSFTRAATGPDGRLYVVGGDNLQSTADLKTVEAFDPATSTWQARATLPTGRGNLAVSTGPDGRIYAFGGDSVTSPGTGRSFDENEAYDVTTNTWQARKRLPEPASGLYSALGPDGRIYVNHGKTMRAYSPERDVWEDVAAPRAQHGVGPIVQGPDGRIYVIGGRDAAGAPTNLVEAYGPVLGVSPTAGAAGTPVVVSGSNFAPYARVAVTLDDVGGPALASGETDAYGAIAPPISFAIPAGVAAGAHAVVVVDDRSRFAVRRAVRIP